MNNGIEPRLYKLRVGSKNNHYLEPADYCFEVTGRDYGNINKQVDLFYRAFKKNLGSMGVMFTGAAGTGKTRMAEKLCNLALEHKMPVVIVTDLKTSIETVNYIGMLRNTVILFDEFGKNFDRNLQDKMLSMFSGVSSGKKLFILTENNTNMVSSFILNRPGRVRYHLDFERLDEDILIEYCSVHGVSKDIFNKIYKIYEKATVFTFDHLQAMVSEVLFAPEDDFEVIMNRLNLSLFKAKEYISVEGVYDMDGIKLPLKPGGSRLLNKSFQRGQRMYMSGNLPVKEEPKDSDKPPVPSQFRQQGEFVSVEITKDDITEVLEDGYICVNGDYKVVLNIV